VRHAGGDIIVVVDGHCEIEGGHFLSNLAGAFGSTGADCVGRPQPLDISDATPLQRAIAAARSSWLGHHPDSHIYSDRRGFVPAGSVAVAYRREVFDKIGWFDERFDACEDYEFNHRVDLAGLRCYFTPAVAVRYRPRQNLKGLFRQMVRYGRGRVRLLRKHPDTFSWKTLVPALLAGCGLLGLVAAWIHPWLAAAVWGALVLYAGVVCGVSASIAWHRRDGAILPKLPWVFFAIHWGAGTGILRECFAGGLGRR
jgi:succinoglycan biosynthesis protein ExoA